MPVTLDLPPQLADEFDHKALAPAEHATLILHLAASLLKDKPSTRFQGAVKEFLSSRSVDAARIASVLSELVEICEGIRRESDACPPLQGGGSESIGIALRGWRDAVVQRLGPGTTVAEDFGHAVSVTPSPDTMTQSIGRSPRVSAFGKYADVPISSEAFAREKQEEIEREERRWR